jgi:hypothetical protein
MTRETQSRQRKELTRRGKLMMRASIATRRVATRRIATRRRAASTIEVAVK